MDRIGIRELRQNASEYVRRAERGETIEVTDRGRPVARLSPLPKPGGIIDRLVADGRMSAPAGHVLDLGPPPPATPGSQTLSELIDELREDRI